MLKLEKRKIKPSPLNNDIYGIDDFNDDFLKDIRKNGIITPLVVDQNNNLISGHRRLNHANMIDEIVEVPVIVMQVANENEAILLMISSNKQREKSWGQCNSEARAIAEVFAAQAKQRQIEGGVVGRQAQQNTKTGLGQIKPKPVSLEVVVDTSYNLHSKAEESLAESIGVGRSSLRKSMEIEDRAPDIFHKVEYGQISLDKGFREMRARCDVDYSPPVKIPLVHGAWCKCGEKLKCPKASTYSQ